MKKLRVLVLVDHSNHSSENSIYPLLNELYRRDEVEFIDLLTRGTQYNNSFFVERETKNFLTSRVDSDFQFSENGFYFIQNLTISNLENYNLILMRLPRPLSDDFLDWLESVFEKHVVFNRPRGIKITGNKKFLLNFPKQIPKSKLCHDIEGIMDFASEKAIVLKPLTECGGKGLMKISNGVLDDGRQEFDALSYLKTIENEIVENGYLAMEFLFNVYKGDKRIIVVDGKIIGATLRSPKEGSWLCNVSQGGTSQSSEPDSTEIDIIRHIIPSLKKEGILIFGADTLVGNDGQRILSEINTMSIGGFHQCKEVDGASAIVRTIDIIIANALENER